MENHAMSSVSAGRKMVLVVDDDQDTLDYLSVLLHDNGYDVRVAPDEATALLQLEEFPADTVIMDVMMPRVDGISLCKSIRENPQTQHIKVLAITAFPEQDYVRKMYDVGADLCLIKPLQFEHFRLEVIRLLNEAVEPGAKTSSAETRAGT